MDAIYRQLQDLSLQIAERFERPLFYRTFAGELASSEAALRREGPIQACRGQLDESLLECAHGICHCEAVARDAGALVMIEGRARGMDEQEIGSLTEAAIMAGLLHDIKRREQDHAVLGSREAERILDRFAFDKRLTGYITYAIRNHEAFKTTCDLGDESGCLVSDALYDADKFRWGPENFTTTVWTMVQDRGTSPHKLYDVFPDKMKGIGRIKETFRTPTGRKYGPEIIDQGLFIGNLVYRELERLVKQGT